MGLQVPDLGLAPPPSPWSQATSRVCQPASATRPRLSLAWKLTGRQCLGAWDPSLGGCRGKHEVMARAWGPDARDGFLSGGRGPLAGGTAPRPPQPPRACQAQGIFPPPLPRLLSAPGAGRHQQLACVTRHKALFKSSGSFPLKPPGFLKQAPLPSRRDALIQIFSLRWEHY